MYIYIILQLGSKGDARELAYNVCIYIFFYCAEIKMIIEHMQVLILLQN